MPGRNRLGFEREPLRAHRLICGDLILVLQRQVDVVVAVHQTPTGVVVDLEWQRHVAAGHGALAQVHGHLAARLLLQQLPQQLHGLLRHDGRQHAVLGGVAVEDVRKARGDDHAEAVVVQGPYRVLAGGTDAEVRPGHQDAALARIFRLVQHELRVAAPCVEQGIVEPGLGHALEEHGGDDLVGVHVRTAQRNAHAGYHSQFFHQCFPL